MASNTWSVYLVRCADGTLYTGISNDVDRRVDLHNQGKGARYTRGRLPVTLVYQESAGARAEATRREAAIKRTVMQGEAGVDDPVLGIPLAHQVLSHPNPQPGLCVKLHRRHPVAKFHPAINHPGGDAILTPRHVPDHHVAQPQPDGPGVVGVVGLAPRLDGTSVNK